MRKVMDHLEFLPPTPPLRRRTLRTDRDREDIKYTQTLWKGGFYFGIKASLLIKVKIV